MQTIKHLPTVSRRPNQHKGKMMRVLRKLWGSQRFTALAFLFWLVSGHAFAANMLTNIDFVATTGDQVEITLALSEPAMEPLTFTINDPARIVLDLPDTSNRFKDRELPIGVGLAQKVNVVEANNRTRVVIELADLVPYSTAVTGNQIRITLNSRSGADVVSSPQFGEASRDATGPRQVTKVDFRRGEAGQGRVLLMLSDPNTVMDMKQLGKETIVTLQGTRIPRDLQKRWDVLDFATPVKTIEATQSGQDTRIVITPTGDFERLAYQSDDLLTIEFRRPLESVLEADRAPVFKGEPITLNFQNVETRAILQILSDVAGKNMVISDSVGGTMALRLQNVPWDQALDIILKSRGLSTREVGNVMFVAPAEEITAREKLELETRQQIQELEPLRSEFLQVNYAKATDLATLIKSKDSSLLSPRGKISVDERTNTLLVQDTAARLRDIRSLVNRLDVPVSQVLIESRIVVANDDFTRAVGSRFGITAFNDFDNMRGLATTSGSLDSTDVAVNQSLESLLDNGTVYPTAVPDAAEPRLNFNLPAAISSPASIAMAVLGTDFLIDLELSALQAEGRGEVIASPRVITANQKTASIRQGVEIPYQEASASGATAVKFKEAVLSLEVTPQITPDNRVIMDLIVNRDSVGENVPTGTGGFIPSIDTREINTQVLVDNGETVVLGGIYEQSTAESNNKVPLLGDIPILGSLFREKRTVDNKTELLIFVTPKILKEGLVLQ